MAKYISTLVNGGKRIDPTIIKSIKKADGSEVSKAEIQEYTRSILGQPEEVESLEISQENIDAILEGITLLLNLAEPDMFFSTFKFGL